jgi:transcriptional regulator with XRE-family HTH domain
VFGTLESVADATWHVSGSTETGGEILRLVRARSRESLREALPALLAERREKLTLSGLASQVGVHRAHLWRIVHGEGKERKPVSPELCRKIALALNLPEDYFPEAREDAVMKAVREDPDLRDQIYDSLR